MRIVSLVPSLSHTLVEMGLRQYIVGVTKFCILPADLHRSSAIVGGTKDPDIEKILSLKPTHILVNEEENRIEDVDVLARETQVVQTFPKGPEDVPAMIRTIGAQLDPAGAKGDWKGMALRMDQRLAKLGSQVPKRNVLYFIWKDPYMVVGNETYISKSLKLFGFQLHLPCHHSQSVRYWGNRHPES